MTDDDFITVEITISLDTARHTVSIEVVRDAWEAADDAQRAEMIHAHVMDHVSWDWTAVDNLTT